MNSPRIGDKVLLWFHGHECWGQITSMLPTINITWVNGNKSNLSPRCTLDSLEGDGRSWELKFA